MPLAVRLLRLVAVLGPVAVVGIELASLAPLKPRQDWGYIVIFLMGLAALGFLIKVTPRALGTIVRHPDLLVPLGVTTTLGSMVGWLGSLPGFVSLAMPFWRGSLVGMSMELSLFVPAAIALAVVHAGWTTVLILQVVACGRADLLAPLTNVKHWFLPTFAALTVGVVGVMLLLVVALAVAMAVLPLGLILMAVLSLVWNLKTAALLPATLRSRAPLGRALAEGWRQSRLGSRRWRGVVVLHMILLGWLTFLHLSNSVTTESRVTTESTTNWHVNGFWTGGYEAGCRWYEQVANAAHTEMLSPLVTLLTLMFGVVAIAVKLTVVRRMDWPAEEGDDAGAEKREVNAHLEPLAH